MRIFKIAIGAIAAIALILVAATLLAVTPLDRTQIAELNQEIQYDDFAFAVRGTREMNAIADLKPQGRFYLVSLSILNHARRVSFTLKPNSPILLDGSRREYPISEQAQRALDAMKLEEQTCYAPIPADGSCTMEIVFDVPLGTRPQWLRISSGGPLGDVLDGLLVGHKVIRLQ